jgi:hypothetical protein
MGLTVRKRSRKWSRGDSNPRPPPGKSYPAIPACPSVSGEFDVLQDYRRRSVRRVPGCTVPVAVYLFEQPRTVALLITSDLPLVQERAPVGSRDCPVEVGVVEAYQRRARGARLRWRAAASPTLRPAAVFLLPDRSSRRSPAMDMRFRPSSGRGGRRSLPPGRGDSGSWLHGQAHVILRQRRRGGP